MVRYEQVQPDDDNNPECTVIPYERDSIATSNASLQSYPETNTNKFAAVSSIELSQAKQKIGKRQSVWAVGRHRATMWMANTVQKPTFLKAPKRFSNNVRASVWSIAELRHNQLKQQKGRFGGSYIFLSYTKINIFCL